MDTTNMSSLSAFLDISPSRPSVSPVVYFMLFTGAQ